MFAILAAAMSIIGSWLVSSCERDQRRFGFKIWMCGNPITIGVMIGVMLNIWSGLPLIAPICTQLYFVYTSYRGWKSNGGVATP